MLLLFKPWLHGVDPVGYYAWLRSAVVDYDLDTTNEFRHFGLDDQVFPSPSGSNRNPYAVGSSVLWSPFFLSAHLVSAILGWPIDGYAPTPILMASLASSLYALVGLWLAYSVAAGLFGAQAALWATLAVWWSTPLLFYMYCHPLMSHANDAFANAVVLAVWWHTRTRRSNAQWLALGMAIGLAALVRLQNLVLVFLPVTETLLTPGVPIRRIAWNACLCIAGLLCVFSLQMVAWEAAYGQLLPGNPYAVHRSRFNLSAPRLPKLLWSSGRSLILWSPIAYAAFVGVVRCALRREAAVGVPILVVGAAQLYIVGSWGGWDGGASFGARLLVGATPLWMLGVAALIDAFRQPRRRLWFGLAGGVLVMWNLLLMAQYIVGLVPHAGRIDVPELLRNQVRVPLVVLQRLPDLLDQRFHSWR